MGRFAPPSGHKHPAMLILRPASQLYSRASAPRKAVTATVWFGMTGEKGVQSEISEL
ncbi:hypothetical protein SAMN05518849_112139 [Sphingobium sp. AP50]|nr:hypothetical protein SAMN05518849_112139 [Sphingobium sp. AP50]